MVSVVWIEQSDDELQAKALLDEAARLVSEYWREFIPGEPDYPVEEIVADIWHSPSHNDVAHALAMVDGEAVGVAWLGLEDIEGRSDQAFSPCFYVSPQHRRTGVGNALLEAMATRARARGRRALVQYAPKTNDAGRAFAQSAGAVAGMVNHQNRVATARLDRRMLEDWVARAAERGGGYSLVAIDGPCPTEWLEPLAAMFDVMNTAPRTEGVEDFALTAGQVREYREAAVSKGQDIWTLCAAHDASGELVAFTEMEFGPWRRWLVFQGDTGVRPEHRNKGLGRWIKAVNALRLLDERPEVTTVQTFNASVNAPMLSINDAMGFEPVAQWQEWRLALPA